MAIPRIHRQDNLSGDQHTLALLIACSVKHVKTGYCSYELNEQCFKLDEQCFVEVFVLLSNRQWIDFWNTPQSLADAQITDQGRSALRARSDPPPALST
jgi:hypothetical protein